MPDENLRIEDAINRTCPWSGKPIAADSLTLYRGAVSAQHVDAAPCGRLGNEVLFERGQIRSHDRPRH